MQPRAVLVAVEQRLLLIHERHTSACAALLCQQRKRIWWKCPLFPVHHAHKWGIQPWKTTADLLHVGQQQRPPTPSFPRPSDVKSNFEKGHMQLISHYFLNEGDCWLVALIGTLISRYWSPNVPKSGSLLERGWKTEESQGTEDGEMARIRGGSGAAMRYQKTNQVHF